MNSIFAAIGILLITAPIAVAQTPILSDSEVTHLFEQGNNTLSFVNISYGPATVVGGPAGGTAAHVCGSGILNQGELQFLQAAARVGIISIQEDASSQSFRQGQSFSWGQMLEQTTAGVQTKLVISPTALGRSLDITGKLPAAQRIKNCIRFMDGHYQVEKVIKREARTKGLTHYMLAYVTYSVEWNKTYVALMQTLGSVRSAQRKSINLWKYDDFTSKWMVQPVAADYSDRDAEFATRSVETFLNAK
jgi:hypothetical protein